MFLFVSARLNIVARTGGNGYFRRAGSPRTMKPQVRLESRTGFNLVYVIVGGYKNRYYEALKIACVRLEGQGNSLWIRRFFSPTSPFHGTFDCPIGCLICQVNQKVLLIYLNCLTQTIIIYTDLKLNICNVP